MLVLADLWGVKSWYHYFNGTSFILGGL